MMCAVESLCLGKFHSHIRDVFAPQVVRYIDLMESSVAQSVHVGFEKENWQPQGYDSCQSLSVVCDNYLLNSALRLHSLCSF